MPPRFSWRNETVKHSWLYCVRMFLCGLVLSTFAGMIGFPYADAIFCMPMLWGLWRLARLHDGFRAACLLSAVRVIVMGAGWFAPILRHLLWESVWSLLLPVCHWIALACFADGFLALRLSRGLSRNRSAAAVVFLQILIDTKPIDGLPMLSTTVILYLAAVWYVHHAARELARCEDPPVIL